MLMAGVRSVENDVEELGGTNLIWPPTMIRLGDSTFFCAFCSKVRIRDCVLHWSGLVVVT